MVFENVELILKMTLCKRNVCAMRNENVWVYTVITLQIFIILSNLNIVSEKNRDEWFPLKKRV